MSPKKLPTLSYDPVLKTFMSILKDGSLLSGPSIYKAEEAKKAESAIVRIISTIADRGIGMKREVQEYLDYHNGYRSLKVRDKSVVNPRKKKGYIV